MYRDSYQHGMLTVFYSVGSKPLAIWETHIQDGHISRFLDDDIKSMVLEIRGTNVSTTYMICPKGKQVLGIHMPFMVMIVKNLKKYFSFEVTILDDTKTRRRFRVSNFQSTSQVLPLSTAMPIGLNDGWNQIQFDLGKFTQRAYQRQFVEVQKVKINANIRLRRIYFARRLVPDDELPSEYKLYFPLASKGARGRKLIEKAKIGEEAEVQPPPVEEKKEGSKTVIEKTASKVSQHSKRPSQEKKPQEAEAAHVLSAEKIPIEVAEGAEGVPAPAEAPAAGEVPAEGVEGVAPEEGKASATKVSSGGAIAQPEGAPGGGETVAAPAEGEAAPAEGEAAPAEAKAAPVEGEAAPVQGEAAPVEGAAAPAEAEAAPAEGEAAPAESEAAPAAPETPAEAPPQEEAPAEVTEAPQEEPAEPPPAETPEA